MLKNGLISSAYSPISVGNLKKALHLILLRFKTCTRLIDFIFLCNFFQIVIKYNVNIENCDFNSFALTKKGLSKLSKHT